MRAAHFYLGTGYNSHPYYIYHSFGFESVFQNPVYEVSGKWDFEERYFAPAPAQPKPVEWHDWPKVTALSAILGWDTLRSLAWRVYGPTNLEGGFLDFKHALETEDVYDDGAVVNFVGWCDCWLGNCKS